MSAPIFDDREAMRCTAGVVDGSRGLAGAREAYAAAAWSTLVEPGDGVAGAIVAALGPERALTAVIRGRLGAAERAEADVSAHAWGSGLARWRPRLGMSAVDSALEAARRAKVRLLLPSSPSWPAPLGDLGPHAPLCLWVRGDASAIAGIAPAAALVGARAASGYGEHVAGELAAELVARTVTIVSGAAYGIDGVAHRAALRAGGATIAFLAGGADRPYPAGHASLLDAVAASGAVVSEVPCGSAPTKWRFLHRNRLIAALSRATVVVEAGWRSGSLNTAGHAAALGRPLGAVPGPVTSAASAGCHRLLRDYDARCITSADDVAELMGLESTDPEVGAPRSDARTGMGTRVVDALSVRSWRDVADIARRSGMSVQDVESVLGILHLEGVVETRGREWRRAAPTGER